MHIEQKSALGKIGTSNPISQAEVLPQGEVTTHFDLIIDRATCRGICLATRHRFHLTRPMLGVLEILSEVPQGEALTDEQIYDTLITLKDSDGKPIYKPRNEESPVNAKNRISSIIQDLRNKIGYDRHLFILTRRGYGYFLHPSRKILITEDQNKSKETD